MNEQMEGWMSFLSSLFLYKSKEISRKVTRTRFQVWAFCSALFYFPDRHSSQGWCFLWLETCSHIFLQVKSMASPRLETFCCPNRDAATDFIINFQPIFFTSMCAGSAGVSIIFSFLQILPKRRGYRRFGMYPLPKPASSSRILFIISVCDILGCVGKEELVHLTQLCLFFFFFACETVLFLKRHHQ